MTNFQFYCREKFISQGYNSIFINDVYSQKCKALSRFTDVSILRHKTLQDTTLVITYNIKFSWQFSADVGCTNISLLEGTGMGGCQCRKPPIQVKFDLSFIS